MQADEDINSLKLLLNNQLKKESSLNCKKLKSGGIHDVDKITFKLFTSNCPFTTKEEIVEDRIKQPPYGSNLVTDTSNYTKFSKTSGTSSNPLLWLDTTKDWNHMLEAWEIIFNHAGLNPKHDKLFFAFSFGPFLGFWTAYDAAAKMNFMTIPGGGLNSNARLKLLADTSANVLLCTPTYALRLGKSIPKNHKLSVNKIIVAGEAGGSIPEIKDRISQLWGNVDVIDHHGMTEVGPVTYQDPNRPSYLNTLPGFHFAEVISPDSNCEVNDGEKGELVLTTLKRCDNALLRYKTGDIVEKSTINVDGHQRLTFKHGILGRTDDMHIIRGVNVFPSTIDAIIQKYNHIGEYRVISSTINSMEEIMLHVELNDHTVESKIINSLTDDLSSSLNLRIPITVVPEGTYKKFEFKSKRWIKE